MNLSKYDQLKLQLDAAQLAINRAYAQGNNTYEGAVKAYGNDFHELVRSRDRLRQELQAAPNVSTAQEQMSRPTLNAPLAGNMSNQTLGQAETPTQIKALLTKYSAVLRSDPRAQPILKKLEGRLNFNQAPTVTPDIQAPSQTPVTQQTPIVAPAAVPNPTQSKDDSLQKLYGYPGSESYNLEHGGRIDRNDPVADKAELAQASPANIVRAVVAKKVAQPTKPKLPGYDSWGLTRWARGESLSDVLFRSKQ